VNRNLARFVHLANALVGVTGLVYAWMRYAMEPSDPYSVVAHPLQPLVQHLHLWTAPLLVFAIGLIWQQHVWKHWRQGVKGGRRSGLTLMLAAAPMIASGYFIQTAVAPAWRDIWIAVHLAASALWVVFSIGHALASKNGAHRPHQRPGRSAPEPADVTNNSPTGLRE